LPSSAQEDTQACPEVMVQIADMNLHVHLEIARWIHLQMHLEIKNTQSRQAI
jgi:hypothetical protein